MTTDRPKSVGIVALTGLFVALITLMSTLYDNYENRRYQRITQRPHVEISWNFSDHHFGFVARNSGNGTAFIRWMSLFVDGQEKESWDNLFEIFAPQDNREHQRFSMLFPGSAMRPVSSDNEWRPLFYTEGGDLARELKVNLDRIQLSVCYCSHYRECRVTYLTDRRPNNLQCNRTTRFTLPPSAQR